jgi:hypothetical protein
METSTSGEVTKDTLKGVLDTHTLAQDLNALGCWCLCYGAVMMHMVWCMEMQRCNAINF